MKTGVGYIISIWEEIVFLGCVAFGISIFYFDANSSLILHSTDSVKTISDAFCHFMSFSVRQYPIIMIVCIIGQKYLGLYNNEYKGAFIGYIFARNLFDDIAYSFYVSFAFIGVLLDLDNGDSKIGTIIGFTLWALTIGFILLGFKTTFM